MEPSSMEWLAQRFEESRAHLRSVAYRMLGSIADAEDAVQETWLRVSRTENSQIGNIRAWLTNDRVVKIYVLSDPDRLQQLIERA